MYSNESERANYDIYDDFKLKNPLVSVVYIKRSSALRVNEWPLGPLTPRRLCVSHSEAHLSQMASGFPVNTCIQSIFTRWLFIPWPSLVQLHVLNIIIGGITVQWLALPPATPSSEFIPALDLHFFIETQIFSSSTRKD